jgi:hypothetical protein
VENLYGKKSNIFLFNFFARFIYLLDFLFLFHFFLAEETFFCTNFFIPEKASSLTSIQFFLYNFVGKYISQVFLLEIELAITAN